MDGMCPVHPLGGTSSQFSSLVVSTELGPHAEGYFKRGCSSLESALIQTFHIWGN